MREHGRGKRWWLLRRLKTVRGSKRAELQTLFAANRRLFRTLIDDRRARTHSSLRDERLSL
jgi:hypothetical protein